MGINLFQDIWTARNVIFLHSPGSFRTCPSTCPSPLACSGGRADLCHFEGDPSLGKQEALLSFREVPALLLCLLPMTLGTCQEGRLGSVLGLWSLQGSAATVVSIPPCPGPPLQVGWETCFTLPGLENPTILSQGSCPSWPSEATPLCL